MRSFLHTSWQGQLQVNLKCPFRSRLSESLPVLRPRVGFKSATRTRLSESIPGDPRTTESAECSWTQCVRFHGEGDAHKASRWNALGCAGAHGARRWGAVRWCVPWLTGWLRRFGTPNPYTESVIQCQCCACSGAHPGGLWGLLGSAPVGGALCTTVAHLQWSVLMYWQ